MSALAALFYLEWRQGVNHLRAIVRHPGRLAMYGIVVAYFVLLIWVRSIVRRHAVVPHLDDPYAAAVLFAYVALLGSVALAAASGAVATFSGPADARFLIGSQLDERVVLTWLQLRRHATRLLRIAFFLVFYGLLFGTAVRFAGLSLSVLAGTLLLGAVPIPMLQLAKRSRKLALALSLTVTCAAVAAAVLTATAHVEMHAPAAVTNALLSSRPSALAVFWTIALAAVAASLLFGRDLYPEMYAASLRATSLRASHRRGFSPVRVAFVDAGTPKHAPLFERMNGPWTSFWKEYLAFVRSPVLRRWFWLTIAACAVGGVAIGHYALASRHPIAIAASFGISALNLFVIFVAFGSSVALRDDISKPLWWMSLDPLWLRLTAWVTGTSWRVAAYAVAFVLAWSIAMRLPELAFFGIPVAIVAAFFLRALGLALYALFPSAIDQRGPLAMLRTLICYALVGPVALVAAILGFFAHSWALAAIVAFAACIGEAALLIAFAAWRIGWRGLALAQSETL